MRSILALLMLASAPAASAQDIACTKYSLDNGMTVILHEDHALPLVSVNLWYDVGAKDERPGRSGFAHLFEHLMFMGTERVPVGAFDGIMEGGGGANNASTSFDRTNYFSWGPAELLPTLLWLDADRLEDLGRMMNQEKLDLQRKVVRNERRQTSENRPYGRSRLKLVAMLFPPGHPYHQSVIGSHEDLQAATVQDVKEFFATYYLPNNVSLVVAGDFEPGPTRKRIAALFGSLERGADPPHERPPVPELHREERATTLDRVQLPMIRYGYHSPIAYSEGDAPMQLAASILGREKSGRLYRRLVMDEPLAVSVSVDQESLLLGSMFTIDVVARPGVALERIERAVDEEIERLGREGPTERELGWSRAARELRILSRMQTQRGIADLLNRYEFYYGEPNSLSRDLQRYRSAGAEQIKTWLARVLRRDARAIVRVLPEAPRRKPSPRDERPAAGLAAPFHASAPGELALANGIPLTLWKRPGLPLVQITLLLEGGTAGDGAERGGLSELLADMLDEGAGERDAREFAAALESLGARFSATADLETTRVTLFTLRRNLEPAARLLADAVLRPRFAPADWKRVKELHLEHLRQLSDRPTEVATRVADRALFGREHPYGLPASGTLDSVAALDLDAVRAAYSRRFDPRRARFLLAGDLDEQQASTLLGGLFNAWRPGAAPAGPTAAGALPSIPERHQLEVLLVDRPGAVQTVIRFAMPGLALGDSRRVPYRMLSMVLGGSFTSRLNQNLREDKGYTYGAGARFLMHPRGGALIATSSVRTDVSGASLEEFLSEFARLRGGDLSAAETQRARRTLRTEAIEARESLAGLIAQASALIEASLPLDSPARDLAAMQSLTSADLNRLARAAVPLERGVLVLVGDAKRIRSQLAGSDLPAPLEVDIEGRPVR